MFKKKNEKETFILYNIYHSILIKYAIWFRSASAMEQNKPKRTKYKKKYIVFVVVVVNIIYLFHINREKER